MPRKSRVGIWALVFIVLIVILACPLMGLNQERIERSINDSIKTELPLGSSYATVIAYLDRHHIEHGTLVRNDMSMPELNNTLDAIVANPIHCFFVSTATQMRFAFSKDRTLTKYDVSLVGTGP